MKQKILVTTIFILSLIITNSLFSQVKSLNFMGKQITFGMSSTEFLNNNVGYNLNTDGTKYYEIKVFRKNEEDDGAWFLIFIKFYKDKLFELKIDETYCTKEEKEDLKKLIEQFKIVKEENTNEHKEYKQYLEKETLVGIYEVDDFGSIFICNEIELLKEVQKKYPEYGNK